MAQAAERQRVLVGIIAGEVEHQAKGVDGGLRERHANVVLGRGNRDPSAAEHEERCAEHATHKVQCPLGLFFPTGPRRTHGDANHVTGGMTRTTQSHSGPNFARSIRIEHSVRRHPIRRDEAPGRGTV